MSLQVDFIDYKERGLNKDLLPPLMHLLYLQFVQFCISISREVLGLGGREKEERKSSIGGTLEFFLSKAPFLKTFYSFLHRK